ncbi:MAG: hypothetical protein ACT4QD_22880 [Acidobacteriota bacterium]
MKRVLAVIVVVLIGVAYLGGYWAEREKRLAAEREAEALRAALAARESQVELARLDRHP